MKPSDTLRKIEALWGVNLCKCKRSPVEIPNVGRLDLAELFADLGFNKGAEVGTEEGFYAKQLCEANSALSLTCVDPWIAYEGYREHVTDEVYDALFNLAKSNLATYDVTFLRKFSTDALEDVPDESLDFVYIDANHDLPHVIEDLVGWSKKVKVGGIISGHDYIRRSIREPVLCHVVEAVQAYTSAYHVKPYMILGRRACLKNEVRDRPRSWMWVKPEPFKTVNL
jgi:hypothetical protein